MTYYGTEKVEFIYFHIDEDVDDMHFIAMELDCDENVFYVKNCCDMNWEWKFYYTASNYELVKHAIFDACFDAEGMDELINDLDCLFEDVFEEIVIWDCECDCATGCNHCGCK